MYVLKTFFLSDRAMIVFEIGDRAKNYSLKGGDVTSVYVRLSHGIQKGLDRTGQDRT